MKKVKEKRSIAHSQYTVMIHAHTTEVMYQTSNSVDYNSHDIEQNLHGEFFRPYGMPGLTGFRQQNFPRTTVNLTALYQHILGTTPLLQH